MDWDATDHIAPDVDAERDHLGQDLRQTGLVVSDSKFQAARQRIGQNFNGDPWFTDGNAVQMRLAP